MILDHMEQMMLQMTELHLQIPSWAKAEQMENCIPQKELWKLTDEPARVTSKSADNSGEKNRFA